MAHHAPQDLASTLSTEQRWRERIAAWHRSGLSARAFTADKPYATSTLRWWSSRLRRAAPMAFIEVRPRDSAADSPYPASCLLLEVGAARVRVTPGFDPSLLTAVVRALSEGAR